MKNAMSTKNPPKVQICLPVYNGQQHIAESIESLLSQTHSNFTLSIFDNVSTDDTAEIVSRYVSSDKRVSLIRCSNFLCATSNWNRALQSIDKTKSQFFMFASDDDLWHPEYISEMLQPMLHDPKIILSYSQYADIDEFGKIFNETGYKNPPNDASAFKQIKALIDEGKYSSIYGVMRTHAIRWVPRMEDVSFGSDLWFMIQIAATGSFRYNPRVLFYKRTGGISASGEDPSSSHDPKRVWNLDEDDWKALDTLPVSSLSKLYIYNRLKISAKLLHPSKEIAWYLLPWFLTQKLLLNPHSFGLRSQILKNLRRARS